MWVIAIYVSPYPGSEAHKAGLCVWVCIPVPGIGVYQCLVDSGYRRDVRARLPSFESCLCELGQVTEPLCALVCPSVKWG